MSDKKVGRIGGRPVTPTDKMEMALSDPGTVNVSDLPHDKGKAAIADKFREREERWRREQSEHDRAANAANAAEQTQAAEPADQQAPEEGGAE
jgi:hypothetical protein